MDDFELTPKEYFHDKGFDSAKSYCGICWNLVTNKVYLAKNSPHITGKCKERHVIPDSIFQRTCERNCGHSGMWWENFRALEKQNRLLRQLAA